jgi:peptide/nickel transport system substrate-binding protein
VAVALVAALAAAGCGGGPSPQPDSTPGTLPKSAVTAPAGPAASAHGPFATSATLDVGLAGEPADWNPLAAAPSPALQAVAAAVLPSAFVAGPQGTAVSNGTLLTSVVSTGTAEQTVTYRIDPRATWSDGTPVTAADFVYTWQAQSGQSRFRDLGGRRFTPSATAGYRRITSVSAGAGDPDVVVVHLDGFDPDWTDLFSPLLAAHVARRIGFDRGFVDPVTALVSAGPFVVQSYQPGDDVVLVRNPRWWGPASDLASITVSFVDTPAIAVSSLERGQLDAAVTAFAPATVATLSATPGLAVSVGDSGTYDALVFDARSGPTTERAVRMALSLAVDRDALARAAVAAGDRGASPVDDRFFLPGTAGYEDDAPSPGGPAGLPAAVRLLRAAGFTRHGPTLVRAGRAVRLALLVATTSPLASDEVAAVRAAATALGMAVTVTTPPAAAAALRAHHYSLALVALRRTPAAAAHYTGADPGDVTGYSGSAMDALVARLATVASVAERDALADRIDALAWTDAVDLPLLPVPSVLTVQSRYVDVTPDPFAGIAWDAATWGIPLPG